MNSWEWESFERILNEGTFSVTSEGPLHGPIEKFSFKRNENLEIILETTSTDISGLRPNPPRTALGTVQINTEKVELTDLSGIKATLTGVETRERVTKLNGQYERKETSAISSIKVIKSSSESVYTIDWLTNVDNRFYLWPDLIVDKITTSKTRTLHPDEITLRSEEEKKNRRSGCVGITINGLKIYVGVATSRNEKNTIRKGFVLYPGTPSDGTREKIRNCLSFSLGMYLVYLGHSTFDSNWLLTSFEAISGYTLDKDFIMPTLPPANIGSRGINELSSTSLSRMVNALYLHYDDLNFRHLNWMYWHAAYAPIHAAPVLFGATIEALQRAYLEKSDKNIQTLLDKVAWDDLKNKIKAAISNLVVSDEMKKILSDKIVDFKKAPQKIISERLFIELNLELGGAEKDAWKQRDYAGHGSTAPNEDFVKLVRDNKLLRIRFNRMLLRMVNGSDNYYDFYTIGHAVRNLQDPIP